MWREPKGNSIRRYLVAAEIVVIAIVIVAIAGFLWRNTGIGDLDGTLQVVIVGLFFLAIVFAVNYVMDRRW